MPKNQNTGRDNSSDKVAGDINYALYLLPFAYYNKVTFHVPKCKAVCQAAAAAVIPTVIKMIIQKYTERASDRNKRK